MAGAINTFDGGRRRWARGAWRRIRCSVSAQLWPPRLSAPGRHAQESGQVAAAARPIPPEVPADPAGHAHRAQEPVSDRRPVLAASSRIVPASIAG